MDSVLTSLRCVHQRVVNDCCDQFSPNSPPNTNSVVPVNATDAHCIDWIAIENSICDMWYVEIPEYSFSPVFRRCLVCCTSYINITAYIAAMIVAQRRWGTWWHPTWRSIRWTKIFWARIQCTIFVLSDGCTWRWCISFVCCRIFGQCSFRWCSLTIFTICPISPVRVRIICCVTSTCCYIMTIFDSVF